SWGARIRTWDRGSKVPCLTTWPRPSGGHGHEDRGASAAVAAPVCGLFAALDELRDTPTALAPELRVASAAKLRLARLATAAAQLGVALRSELRLARLTTLAAETRVALGSELALSPLTTAPAAPPVEGRPTL